MRAMQAGPTATCEQFTIQNFPVDNGSCCPRDFGVSVSRNSDPLLGNLHPLKLIGVHQFFNFIWPLLHNSLTMAMTLLSQSQPSITTTPAQHLPHLYLENFTDSFFRSLLSF
jgi:hypothetical protein